MYFGDYEFYLWSGEAVVRFEDCLSQFLEERGLVWQVPVSNEVGFRFRLGRDESIRIAHLRGSEEFRVSCMLHVWDRQQLFLQIADPEVFDQLGRYLDLHLKCKPSDSITFRG